MCQNSINDHYYTILSFNKFGVVNQNNNIVNKEKVDHVIFDKLKNILYQENWVNVLNSTNVDTAIEIFFLK